MSRLPLPTVKLIDGAIRITIPIDYVRHSLEVDDRSVVLNQRGFAKDVVAEMRFEEEDGTTPVHLMLDQCIESAVESGTEHVAEQQACPECGQWTARSKCADCGAQLEASP